MNKTTIIFILIPIGLYIVVTILGLLNLLFEIGKKSNEMDKD